MCVNITSKGRLLSWCSIRGIFPTRKFSNS